MALLSPLKKISTPKLLCLFLIIPLAVVLWCLKDAHSSLSVSATFDVSFLPPAITSSEESPNSTNYSNKTLSKTLSKNNTGPINCFPHNSEEWLKGPRIGNHNEPLMNDAFIKRMTLELPYMLSLPGKAKPYLGQTISFENSRFMNDAESDEDPKSMRLWSVRLLYLTAIYHQHREAIPEAEALYSDEDTRQTCQKEREARGIGLYDYECPNAKYIIAPLSSNGMGANVRSGTTKVLLAGLITGRIVHFVNKASSGKTFALRKSWPLVSCKRGDAQCFLLPPSPCTLVLTDLDNAYHLNRMDTKKLFKKSKLPLGHEDDKVWVMPMDFTPQIWTPPKLKGILHKYANSLIASVPENDPRLPVMTLAANHLLDEDPPRPGYDFAAANLKLNHALSFYSMRPNLEFSEKMEEIMSDIIPDNFDADNSFGLPIRASDKCVEESECLTFSQHMKGVSQLWREHQNKTGTKSHPAVVFTTEATGMVQAQKEFASNVTLQSGFPFEFRFVTNDRDVVPDSGFVKHFIKKANATANDFMLSAMTSFKFQLLPRVSLGNCCSNFHILLNDFLAEGLGAASENTFKCFQEFRDEDIDLKICCGWHHQCKAEKADRLAVLANKTISTSVTSR